MNCSGFTDHTHVRYNTYDVIRNSFNDVSLFLLVVEGICLGHPKHMDMVFLLLTCQHWSFARQTRSVH